MPLKKAELVLQEIKKEETLNPTPSRATSTISSFPNPPNKKLIFSDNKGKGSLFSECLLIFPHHVNLSLNVGSEKDDRKTYNAVIHNTYHYLGKWKKGWAESQSFTENFKIRNTERRKTKLTKLSTYTINYCNLYVTLLVTEKGEVTTAEFHGKALTAKMRQKQNSGECLHTQLLRYSHSYNTHITYYSLSNLKGKCQDRRVSQTSLDCETEVQKQNSEHLHSQLMRCIYTTNTQDTTLLVT